MQVPATFVGCCRYDIQQNDSHNNENYSIFSAMLNIALMCVIMLNKVTLSVVIPNVIMLSDIVLGFAMLSVIMLSVDITI